MIAVVASPLVAGTLLLGMVAALWWLDRLDGEVVRLLALATVAGAVAALVLGWATSSPGGALAAPGWPLIVSSELVKGVAVALAVMLSRRLTGPVDGLAAGAAAGLAFTAVAGAASGQAAGGGAATGVGSLFVEQASEALAQALATGFFGALFALATLARSARSLLFAAAAAGAVALGLGRALALLPALGGASGVAVGGAATAAVALAAALLGALALAAMIERRITVDELDEEVALGAVPAWVADAVPPFPRPCRPRFMSSRAERRVVCGLLRRLALRRRELRGRPDAELAALELVRLRQRLRSLLRDRGEEG